MCLRGVSVSSCRVDPEVWRSGVTEFKLTVITHFSRNNFLMCRPGLARKVRKKFY
jgi:hypothetical protein